MGAIAPSVRLEGIGLHSGVLCGVVLRQIEGPCRLRVGATVSPIADLHVVRTDRGVTVKLGRGGPTVDLVEHLLAALAAFGIRDGLEIEVAGGEVPLLDGGARAFCAAIRQLAPPRAGPRLAVARRAEIRHDKARYSFVPGPAVGVHVVSRFVEPIGVQRASWAGDAAAFEETIAPARTFGFASEIDELRRAGRARHVDPRAVMVFDAAGRMTPPGAPMGPDEVARHKLLDLLGDLYLHGGPPVGSVSADRPGHGATHAVVRRALGAGILLALGRPPAPR
jgi:UDP-3-O-[3-hydroxymyristoyl] N-acetylglucosamine deacetylase